MTVPLAEPAWPRAGGGPARQASLRRHNLALVLAQLDGAVSFTRAQLARRSGLTKATVSSLVEALLGAGVLEELADTRPVPPVGLPVSVGRPGSPLQLGRSRLAALGLEVAADYLAGCVLDLAGELRHERLLLRDNREERPGATLAAARELCGELAEAAAVDGLQLFGAGVALPGVVVPEGDLRFAPNLPAWRDLPVSELLGEALRPFAPRLRIGNEANLAALAELWHGGHGLADFLLVSGEVGVGSGLVLRGQLYPGSSGAAGELGHLMVDPEGPRCGCGACGCLEQVAGQEALLRAAGIGHPPGTSNGGANPAVAELLARARDGDRRTLQALALAGQALGTAVAAALNLVDVPAVVLGGLYAQLAPHLLPTLEAELRQRLVRNRWSPVRLLVSGLGPGAAVRGAAGAMVRDLLADPAAFLPDLAASTGA